MLQRNNHATRDGQYLQPTLTKAVAANMTLDMTFNPSLTGHVYAQPLYIENGPANKAVFLVATESNNVYAIAEADGAIVWSAALGPPAPQAGAPCGNIQPIGVTGTPVVDPTKRIMYMAAAIGNATGIARYEIHGLFIDTGREAPGFPLEVKASIATATFDPVMQNQRGALLLLQSHLYVPFGGHTGDCGSYRGWIIGVDTAGSGSIDSFVTMAPGGGIWGPGGLSSDGTSIFASTGNTFGASTWSQGEAVLRLNESLDWSGLAADYFTPSNWKDLDASDLDLGGSGQILVDVPGASPSSLVVAFGKNGVAYLLDRDNLGGVGVGDGVTGEGLASAQVGTQGIVSVPATYRAPSGVYVVVRIVSGFSGAGCPSGTSGDLVALKIESTAPPTMTVAWCADNQGRGEPIATTTDGVHDALVWTVGAEGSQRLHAYDGESGALVYGGGGASDVLAKPTRHFVSPVAVHGRIVVGADDGLYAFKSQ